MRRLSSMLAAVSLLWATPAGPAAQHARTATIDAVVTDRAGNEIHGLAAADFRVVTADGKVLPVVGVREVTIPLAARGKATAAAEARFEATNRHARDARLFVVVVQPAHFDQNSRSRVFMDELVAGMNDDDHLALLVAGAFDLSLPPTSDTAVIARTLDRLEELGGNVDGNGLTWLMRNEMPKVYRSLMAVTWARRAIVLLTPGTVGPEAFFDQKSWEAWALRANAPMHAVDLVGREKGSGLPLLKQATEETGGLLFVNQLSATGLASKILDASSRFYEVQVEFPAGVKTDQSIYTTARSHPTSRTRARLRVRAPEPLGLSAHMNNELRTALGAALPMDEIPLSFGVESMIGATAATVKFLSSGAGDRETVEVPTLPLRLAFGAMTAAGKLQELGARDIGPEDIRIDGCCLTVQQDIVIPKDAISVRVAVYQHPTGKVGAVFIPIDRELRRSWLGVSGSWFPDEDSTRNPKPQPGTRNP